MFAKLARIDIDNLRQQGFSPTDEEVIQLNDIAVRIENGKESTVVNRPRTAHAGSICLYEPTIGSLVWWNDFGKDAGQSDEQKMIVYFFMLAHAKDVKYLESLDNDAKILKEVKRWQKSVDATVGEMWRALLYVKRAYDFDCDEDTNEKLSDEDFMEKLWMNVIACAGALSVTPDQLKCVTQSELVNLLIQANLHVRIPMKTSVAKDYIEYRQLMRKIEDRHNKKEDKENG